ncbi:hypothetical protein ACVNS2_16655 [Paenibacillus caseinilyticus]|uniref:Uncharacterized protein n=1 Tax=Paenibacillus mucilaginosus K02 TaxID=997761 RepID=I0BIS6_9BACL|nr:hypothetical protein [Paenibacillus mucilaginosus]AFH62273.1 hypothetical protein B2K_16355 [Paenibacillus mucilaginosus K02]
MTNRIYAQIQDGKVVAISELAADLVPIDTNDSRLLGTAYTGSAPVKVPTSSFTGLSVYVASDKTEISADGVDAANITLTVKTWDGQNSEYSGKVGLNIGSTKLTLDLVNGEASYSFKTSTPGIYSIQTSGSAFTSHGKSKVEAV